MGRAAIRTRRLDTSVTDAPTVEKAQRLMAILETGNADLYRGALDVFDWCVRRTAFYQSLGFLPLQRAPSAPGNAPLPMWLAMRDLQASKAEGS